MAGKILKGKLIGVIGDKVGVFQINASGERTPTIGRLVIRGGSSPEKRCC